MLATSCSCNAWAVAAQACAQSAVVTDFVSLIDSYAIDNTQMHSNQSAGDILETKAMMQGKAENLMHENARSGYAATAASAAATTVTACCA